MRMIVSTNALTPSIIEESSVLAIAINGNAFIMNNDNSVPSSASEDE